MHKYPTRPLKSLVAMLSGGTPAKGEPSYWTGAIPWLTPKDMGNWHGKTENSVTQQGVDNGTRLAPAGSVFVAVRGMSLHKEIRVVHCDFALTFNQDIKALVPKDGIDSQFLFFALRAEHDNMLAAVESAGHGTGATGRA